MTKKKKKKKRGKKNKKRGKKYVIQPTMAVGNVNVEENSSMHCKPKYPCKICKGDHLLIDFHGIPKVFEVW